MQKESKIYIAGHRGLVGSAIRHKLESFGYKRLVLRTSSDLDLTRQQAVEEFFAWESVDYVFLASATVSAARSESCPADTLYRNLAIESNIISSAHQAGVKRLLYVDSSCIYPYLIPQSASGEGSLVRQWESANRARAIVRIAGIEMCNAFNSQHGCRYLAVAPPSLYGIRDNYSAYNSNAIPAMIREMHVAKMNGEPEVVLREAAETRREFLYSDDLANACICLMSLPDLDFDVLVSGRSGPLINIGSEHDLSIRELGELIAEAVLFPGRVQFDTNQPHTIPHGCFDVRTAILRPCPQMDIKEGLRWAYNDFLSRTRAMKANRTVQGPEHVQTELNANDSVGNSNGLEAESPPWCRDAQLYR
jgi:GDP-L-fucose synthase